MGGGMDGMLGFRCGKDAAAKKKAKKIKKLKKSVKQMKMQQRMQEMFPPIYNQGQFPEQHQ
jgi:hypothetical protein